MFPSISKEIVFTSFPIRGVRNDIGAKERGERRRKIRFPVGRRGWGQGGSRIESLCSEETTGLDAGTAGIGS